MYHFHIEGWNKGDSLPSCPKGPMVRNCKIIPGYPSILRIKMCSCSVDWEWSVTVCGSFATTTNPEFWSKGQIWGSSWYFFKVPRWFLFHFGTKMNQDLPWCFKEIPKRTSNMSLSPKSWVTSVQKGYGWSLFLPESKWEICKYHHKDNQVQTE